MIKRISSIIIFIFMLNLVSTADAKEIKIFISIDKTRVEVGNHFRLTIGVQGAFDTDIPQITPPENFILMYGPSVSTQTSIVNNVVTIFRGFTYSFSPTETGKFELGPASLEYKGKVYTSDIVRIEVVKRTPFEGGVTPDRERSKRIDIYKRIFIELTTDKKEAYIYEQIIESFKLFFQKGLPIDNLDYDAASTKSFLAEKLGEERRYEEVRDGILYNVIELRTALFPLVSGNIEIPPAKFKCDIIIRQQSYSNSIFDEFIGRGGRKYPIERSTDSIKLKIKSLPELDKPEDFAGTVGKFTMDVLAKPIKVKVGDPITLSINIRGEGNIQTIGEPVITPGDEKDFKIYPAETDMTITDRGEGIRGEKLFSKVIEPQHEDIDFIPVISFSYFDPELEKYKTITHDPIPIVVEHSDLEIPIRFSLEDAEKVKGQVKILTKDILPIMSDLYSFKNQGFAIYNRPLFLAFIFLTPILVVIVCIYVQRHRELLQTDVGYARKRRALSRAKKQLSNARQLIPLDKPSEFYSTLAKTVMEHIADKLNLASASITSDNISGILESRGVSHDVIKELKQCLESCDYGRFSASQHSKDQMVRTLDTAEEFIMHLEKQL